MKQFSSHYLELLQYISSLKHSFDDSWLWISSEPPPPI